MSVCESISSDEFPVSVNMTIPLHPLLRSMIEKEQEIITEENQETFNQTQESVLESVKSWGPSIAYIRPEFITPELCKEAIKHHSGAIMSIKPDLLTKEQYYELCLNSVKENGWNMKFIPKEVHTQELVDAAINSACWAIQYTEDRFKTPENCLEAVKRNGQTLEYVPKEFITKEICEYAVKSRYECLNFIPAEFLTKELCETAVKGDGINVKWVPDEFMSSDLAYLAIRSPAPSNPSDNMAGANIQYIKGEFLTKEIIVESAKKWWSTYSRIPKECLTEEVEEAVLDVAPYCIKWMKQTPERCMKAFKMCPRVIIDYIDAKNITKEMVEHLDTFPEGERRFIKKMFNDERIRHCMSLIKSD